MNEFETLASQKVPDESAAHAVFGEMETCISVYETLADLVFGFVSKTRPLVGNVDSFFFDSLAGTVESIKTVLSAGRIADAYTLLRRMKDTSLLQLHVMVQFEKRNARLAGFLASEAEVDSEEFIRWMEDVSQQGMQVEEIDRWIPGEESLKGKRPSQSGSSTIEDLHFLFEARRYKAIFDRCIEHVHINSFRILRLNATISSKTQLAWLEQFAQDFRDIFVWHVAYLFTLHPEYMMSTDYVDALECGFTPIEDSQYWVAPIVQEAFNKVVSSHRPDVRDFLRQHCSMQLT